ncbi:alpha/beta fold hydrolase [Nesterenkonia sp. MY13]|uniref:Alpha/beta fold hydrolase n=1 Tax=Nesterenkonia sedimenti TaxID=1463632 RepID=A0A7X8TK46_9MICC|nr:alpha/beta fold hydrolase [Nesterenkonia sedimenti]NLS10280.1 alpha/beta fold hydrolase [Nesterenkonia sedimenti]
MTSGTRADVEHLCGPRHGVRAAGTNTGALVLHGFTSTTDSVQPVADALEEAGIPTEVPLLPGHGTTWEDLSATRAEEILQAVTAAYDRLQTRCTEVVPVGLSMGGALALWVAAQKDSPGVVAINPGLRLTPGTGLLARLLAPVKPTLGAIAGDIARPGVREIAYPVTPVRAVTELSRIFAESRRSLPKLADRKTPVLLLRSAIDQVVGQASVRLLKAAVPQTREVILRRSRHVAPLDFDAELLNRRSVQFVTEVSGSA